MSQDKPKTAENGDNKRQSTSGKTRLADNVLPLARIRKIMKMDQNISGVNIGVEATYLICTATELFIQWLSKEVYETDKKALSYASLSKYIQKEERLDFLRQIAPEKITIREYKKILADEVEKIFDSGSDVSSSSDEESGSNEEEESVQEVEESSEEEQFEDDEKEKKS
ncbi:hypothetical protein PVAND_012932 [Polypedilum vanderplanki]|uniref:Transcription factor CBF/NF-Y/archaeal histone domain-containing protein n=1 Tax=Polypedilum vanderplanki TaxID=319348 RepID=A0A9J6CN59_POLVA|nr:hypothetical protein PVAND_012932 [Polypedilum vanderplanki]